MKNPLLEDLLGRVFDSFQEEEEESHAERRQEFVFHMTDWERDLRLLVDLYREPAKFSQTEADNTVSGFLYHAVGHLNAAARLLVDYAPDPFAKPSE